ncbi:MAG: DUF167 family protein [Paludibacter sp.]
MAKKKQKKEFEALDVQHEVNNPRDVKSFYAWDGDVLILNVLGTPNSKRDAIGKPFGNQLKISVREDPQGGRATDYMVRFLSGEFGVAVKDIEVVKGRFNVNKQLRIKNPQKLPAVIEREESIVPIENNSQKRKK